MRRDDGFRRLYRRIRQFETILSMSCAGWLRFSNTVAFCQWFLSRESHEQRRLLLRVRRHDFENGRQHGRIAYFAYAEILDGALLDFDVGTAIVRIMAKDLRRPYEAFLSVSLLLLHLERAV